MCLGMESCLFVASSARLLICASAKRHVGCRGGQRHKTFQKASRRSDWWAQGHIERRRARGGSVRGCPGLRAHRDFWGHCSCLPAAQKLWRQGNIKAERYEQILTARDLMCCVCVFVCVRAYVRTYVFVCVNVCVLVCWRVCLGVRQWTRSKRGSSSRHTTASSSISWLNSLARTPGSRSLVVPAAALRYTRWQISWMSH